MEMPTQYEMQPLHVLMLSVLVFYLGLYLNRKIRFLSDYYIPPAVTGGLICSVVVGVIYGVADLEIAFDMQIRDVLLLVFFSTIGLTAKVRTLVAGGILGRKLPQTRDGHLKLAEREAARERDHA